MITSDTVNKDFKKNMLTSSNFSSITITISYHIYLDILGNFRFLMRSLIIIKLSTSLYQKIKPI